MCARVLEKWTEIRREWPRAGVPLLPSTSCTTKNQVPPSNTEVPKVLREFSSCPEFGMEVLPQRLAV